MQIFVLTYCVTPNTTTLTSIIGIHRGMIGMVNKYSKTILFISPNTHVNPEYFDFKTIMLLNVLKYAGVFYCGRPVLAKELKKLAHEMSHKTSTRFEFHKEQF